MNEKLKSEEMSKQITYIKRRKTNLKKTTKVNNEVKFKKEKLKIIPLGGLLEIGKNITVFEYEESNYFFDNDRCFIVRFFSGKKANIDGRAQRFVL